MGRWVNLFFASSSYWNKCHSINSYWLEIGSFHWYIMVTINLDDRIWRSNLFFNWFENRNHRFWNSFERNICNISQFESVNWSRNRCFDGNQLRWIGRSRINWNVRSTIKFENFLCLVVDWNIIFTIDNYNMSWVIWLNGLRLSDFRFGDYFCFEGGSESFRNDWNWDISCISFYNCVNWSFFQRQYWSNSINLSLCSYFNWNVNLTIEYDRFWFLRNWNVVLSIDLDDWMDYSFNWNVIDAIDYNNFAVFDTLIFFTIDFNCCYFIQFNIGFINICLFLANRSNWNVLFSSNNDWGSWYEFATSKCDWFNL